MILSNTSTIVGCAETKQKQSFITSFNGTTELNNIERTDEPAHPRQVEMPIWCHIDCKLRDQMCTKNAINGSKRA
jgi:hypothetical protein